MAERQGLQHPLKRRVRAADALVRHGQMRESVLPDGQTRAALARVRAQATHSVLPPAGASSGFAPHAPPEAAMLHPHSKSCRTARQLVRHEEATRASRRGNTCVTKRQHVRHEEATRASRRGNTCVTKCQHVRHEEASAQGASVHAFKRKIEKR